MKVLDMQERWIHTHIILGSGRLPPEDGAVIGGVINPILRRHSIVYGYHLVEEPTRGVTRIVLECVPLEAVQRELRAALVEALKPIPAKAAERNTVTGIRVDAGPGEGASARARR